MCHGNLSPLQAVLCLLVMPVRVYLPIDHQARSLLRKAAAATVAAVLVPGNANSWSTVGAVLASGLCGFALDRVVLQTGKPDLLGLVLNLLGSLVCLLLALLVLTGAISRDECVDDHLVVELSCLRENTALAVEGKGHARAGKHCRKLGCACTSWKLEG